MMQPMPFKDPEKRRAYGRAATRKRYAKDPAKGAEYMRTWRTTRTPAQVALEADSLKAWRAANPEKVKAVEAARPDRKAYHRDFQKKLRTETPDVIWRRNLKKYGLTIDGYNELLARQNGQCAICGREGHDKCNTRLAVDHCHATKKVRGLLCGNCNNGLGRFQDDVALLERALSYLKAT